MSARINVIAQTRHDPAYRKANAGHLDCFQLCIKRAIEARRAAALSRDVQRCRKSWLAGTGIVPSSQAWRHSLGAHGRPGQAP